MTRADIEFYYSGLVLKLAYLLTNSTPKEFSAFSYRRRKKWLDRATKMTEELLSDDLSRDVMVRIGRQHVRAQAEVR